MSNQKVKECDCLKESEAKLAKHLIEQIGHKEVNLISGDFQNVALAMNGKSKLYFPFEYKFTYKNKKGEVSKSQKRLATIFPAFCPFCGIPMNNN